MGHRRRHAESNRLSAKPPGKQHPPGIGAATRAVTAGRREEWTSIPGKSGGVVNPPVWRASTHLYPDVAALRRASQQPDPHGFFYGRRGGPTQWALAEALTDMEPGAGGTVLYPSGVAAIAGALLSVLSPGDEVLITDNAYDPTRSLAEGLLTRMGISARYYDPHIGGAIAEKFGPNTRAIWLEAPGSLTFEVPDVPAICAAARAANIVTLLDNTWATPQYLGALAHGVDISVLAATKYITGHSDVMLGSATATPRYWPRLNHTAQQLGQVVSPDDAALALRGLRTLAVRLARHQESALAIARWLEQHEDVADVLHPALPSHRSHALWQRDFSGSSGLFAFALANGGEARRAAFIDALSLFGIGYSWGGFESLALPVDPHRYRSATHWPDDRRLIRLHIGLEDVDDLIADLGTGFAAYHRQS
jgi:cystathionine beta-lyase